MKNEKKMLLNRLSFPNVLIGNLNLWGVHKAEVPDYKSRGRQHFIKAFTLIELLVVVLIIGILSAIALPQYTVAVEKARMAEALQNAASLRRAIEVYILENETRSFNLNDLSINLENCDELGICYSKYFVYSVSNAGLMIDRVNNGDVDYELYFWLDSSGTWHPGCQESAPYSHNLCAPLYAQGWAEM